jgi:hypothetical protein
MQPAIQSKLLDFGWLGWLKAERLLCANFKIWAAKNSEGLGEFQSFG